MFIYKFYIYYKILQPLPKTASHPITKVYSKTTPKEKSKSNQEHISYDTPCIKKLNISQRSRPKRTNFPNLI